MMKRNASNCFVNSSLFLIVTFLSSLSVLISQDASTFAGIYPNLSNTESFLFTYKAPDTLHSVDTIPIDDDNVIMRITEKERNSFGYLKYNHFFTFSSGLVLTSLSGSEFGVNYLYLDNNVKHARVGFFGSAYYSLLTTVTDTTIEKPAYYDWEGRYHPKEKVVQSINNDFNIVSAVVGLCVVPQINERMYIVVRFGPGVYQDTKSKSNGYLQKAQALGMLSVTASYFFTDRLSADFTAKYYYYDKLDHFFLPNISLTLSL